MWWAAIRTASFVVALLHPGSFSSSIHSYTNKPSWEGLNQWMHNALKIKANEILIKKRNQNKNILWNGISNRFIQKIVLYFFFTFLQLSSSSSIPQYDSIVTPNQSHNTNPFVCIRYCWSAQTTTRQELKLKLGKERTGCSQ